MNHVHCYTAAGRFKWLSGAWFRRYRCTCGAKLFKREETA